MFRILEWIPASSTAAFSTPCPVLIPEKIHVRHHVSSHYEGKNNRNMQVSEFYHD
jgi:hypothetical protein